MYWLTTLVAAILVFDISSANPPSPYHPSNIVVIVADDLGVDMVGAYERFIPNHPDPAYPNTTPSLDYLAKTGMMFLNAWTNPVCSPTRAQILTGRHGFRSGMGRIVLYNLSEVQAGGLSHELATIPAVLRSPRAKYPYHTAGVGKWHLAGPGQHPPPSGRLHPLGSVANPWFHQFAGIMHGLSGQTYNNWKKNFGTTIIPGVDECVPPAGSFCHSQVSDYATVDTADDAVYLLETMPEPFFLYTTFVAPHTPLNPPDVPLTAASCLGGLVSGDPECSFAGDIPTKTRCMVRWLDNEVGRIICAIEDSALRPDLPTTIIFMGDNGTRGDAIVPPFDETHGKGTLYQGGIRVPLIVKSPLIAKSRVGSASKALITATDIFATVAELAHAPLPDDPFELRDSVSMVPYLQARIPSIRRYAYAEFFDYNFAPDFRGEPPPGYSLDQHRRAIRNARGFKLLQTVTRNLRGRFSYEEELYDLNHDPHEQIDLIGEIDRAPYDNEYANLRRELDTIYPHRVTSR